MLTNGPPLKAAVCGEWSFLLTSVCLHKHGPPILLHPLNIHRSLSASALVSLHTSASVWTSVCRSPCKRKQSQRCCAEDHKAASTSVFTTMLSEFYDDRADLNACSVSAFPASVWSSVSIQRNKQAKTQRPTWTPPFTALWKRLFLKVPLSVKQACCYWKQTRCQPQKCVEIWKKYRKNTKLKCRNMFILKVPLRSCFDLFSKRSWLYFN